MVNKNGFVTHADQPTGNVGGRERDDGFTVYSVEYRRGIRISRGRTFSGCPITYFARDVDNRDQSPRVDGGRTPFTSGVFSERSDNAVTDSRNVRGGSHIPLPDTILGGGQGRTPADTFDTANAMFAIIAIVTVAVSAIAIAGALQ